VDGQVLEAVEAHGKHLLYRFSGRPTVHVHLGLVGRFRTYTDPPQPSPATRMVIGNDRGAAHLSGPMTCRLIDASQIAEIVGNLGPDPLRPGTRIEPFARALAADDRPIGAVLLDQGVVAGVGNVYRSEVLFLCGIHPKTPASELDDNRVKELWSTIRAELRTGVEDGRIVTVRPRDVGAARRSELPTRLRLYAYKRDHRPCLRCRTPITGSEMAGRRIWWCPACQPAG
jgi:endonuclease-8